MATAGLFLLVYSGIMLPVSTLDDSGSLIYFAAFLLITVGLLPYVYLKKLENHPLILTCSEKNGLQLMHKGAVKLQIELQNVKKADYVKSKNFEGIELNLCDISKAHQYIGAKKYIHNKSSSNKIVLKHFSKRSFREIHEFLLK